MSQPEGLTLLQKFVSTDEQIALLAEIDAAKWDLTLTRRTQHYGFRYSYADKKANVKTTPIPEAFEPLIQRLLETGVITHRPDQCIVNEYSCGQGIGHELCEYRYQGKV
jgi:alkylated DNA repair dioxygenase AlkB